MQWFVDIVKQLVIDALGIPPCYIDRGDPSDHDFQLIDFTRDGAWHELDLSAIVPAGVSCVSARISISGNSSQQGFAIRKHGNSNDLNVSYTATQWGSVPIHEDIIFACDTNRIIEYRSNVNLTTINLTIKGWWL
jgi:hypothetical protein